MLHNLSRSDGADDDSVGVASPSSGAPLSDAQTKRRKPRPPNRKRARAADVKGLSEPGRFIDGGFMGKSSGNSRMPSAVKKSMERWCPS